MLLQFVLELSLRIIKKKKHKFIQTLEEQQLSPNVLSLNFHAPYSAQDPFCYGIYMLDSRVTLTQGRPKAISHRQKS